MICIRVLKVVVRRCFGGGWEKRSSLWWEFLGCVFVNSSNGWEWQGKREALRRLRFRGLCLEAGRGKGIKLRAPDNGVQIAHTESCTIQALVKSPRNSDGTCLIPLVVISCCYEMSEFFSLLFILKICCLY